MVAERATTSLLKNEIEGDLLSKKDDIERKTEDLLEQAITGSDLRIYDVEYVKEGADYYLRCYIDKDSGVTIDDCESVSRKMSDLLDKDDFIDEAYILEVSSPGLGRALKKDRHLSYSIGQEVEIKLYKSPPDSKDKEFSGILKSFDEKNITVDVSVSDKETVEMIFEKKNIAVIRLALDF